MKVDSLLATLIASLFFAGAAAAAKPAPIFVEIHEPHLNLDPQSETFSFHNGLLRVTLHFDLSAPKVTSVEAICNGRRHSFVVHDDYYVYSNEVGGRVEMENGRFFQATFDAGLTTQHNGKVLDHFLSIVCDRREARFTIEENTLPPKN